MEVGERSPHGSGRGRRIVNVMKYSQGLLHNKDLPFRGKDISWYLPQMEEEHLSHFSQAPLALLSYLGRKNMINKGQSFTWEIVCEYCSQEESRGQGKKSMPLERYLWRLQPWDRTTKTLRFKQNIIECSPPTYLPPHQQGSSIVMVNYSGKNSETHFLWGGVL